MIVCSCTGLTDAEVRAAAAAGVRIGRDVHAACGKARDCNGCLPGVCALLRSSRGAVGGQRERGAAGGRPRDRAG